MWASLARFVVCHSGRRSGKTELAKRQLAIRAHAAPPGSILFAAAPTWDQVARVFWDDLVKLVTQLPVLSGLPAGCTIAKKSGSKGDMYIDLVGGQRIMLISGDAADRAEGMERGLWWGVIDEYGNMPETVWGENIRPQLAQNVEAGGGGAWLIGVPHGGGSHYQDLADRARAQRQARQFLMEADAAGARGILEGFYGASGAGKLIAGGLGNLDWDAYCWPSEDVLPPSEVAKMAEDMDPSLFEQEAHGAFVSFSGRVYKPFDLELHCAPYYPRYRPDAPLHLSLDFNVAPGAGVVGQDMQLAGGERGTAYIGEIAIPQDSTTELLCRAFIDEWEGHSGPVYVRGDATGGKRGTTAADPGGTDWTIARNMLGPRFRCVWDVPNANPAETDRVNCTNARLLSADGRVRVGVDPARCPSLTKDLQRVVWMKGVRAIDKSDPSSTHWTDALGYDLSRRFPIADRSAQGRRELRLAVA